MAVVTGASSGLGERFARVLHAVGADVVITARRADRLAALAADLPGVHVVGSDLSVAEGREQVVASTLERFGRLDVLVNNAGTTEFIPHVDLDSVTPEKWQRILNVNLVGPFLCSRAVRAAMEASGGGAIVMTSSVEIGRAHV